MAEYPMICVSIMTWLLIVTSVNFIEGSNLRSNSTGGDTSLTSPTEAKTSSPLTTNPDSMITSSSHDNADNYSGKYPNNHASISVVMVI